MKNKKKMYKMVCVNGYNYMGVYYLIHLDDGGCGGLLWLAMVVDHDEIDNDYA